jgi:hypothetical protein
MEMKMKMNMRLKTLRVLLMKLVLAKTWMKHESNKKEAMICKY